MGYYERTARIGRAAAIAVASLLLAGSLGGCSYFQEPKLSQWNPPNGPDNAPCNSVYPWVNYDKNGNLYCTVRPYDGNFEDIDQLNDP